MSNEASDIANELFNTLVSRITDEVMKRIDERINAIKPAVNNVEVNKMISDYIDSNEGDDKIRSISYHEIERYVSEDVDWGDIVREHVDSSDVLDSREFNDAVRDVVKDMSISVRIDD